MEDDKVGKKNNRQIRVVSIICIVVFAFAGILLSKNGSLKEEVLSQKNAANALMENNAVLSMSKKRLEDILASGKSKLEGVEHVFNEIKNAHDMWMYFSEHPQKVAYAISTTVASYDDVGLRDMGRLLMGKFRDSFVGAEWAFNMCPPEMCPGEDGQLAAVYESLDDKYMRRLGQRMRDELPILIAKPQIIHGLILLKGDDIFSHICAPVDIEQVYNLIKTVRSKYLDVAKRPSFLKDMENYLVLNATEPKLVDYSEDESALTKINEYRAKVRDESDRLESYWNMSMDDQQLIYEYLSQDFEEWERIFDLLERKFKV